MRCSLLCLLALSLVATPASAQWPRDGLRVCGASQTQMSPAAVPNGAGDVVTAWQDARWGFNLDLWAQRLRATGTTWAVNGVAVTGKSCTRFPAAGVTDSAGGVYLAWPDDRCTGQKDLYAARLNSAGQLAPGWLHDGTPVCAEAGDQWAPSMAPDGAGGAIVAWADRRTGTHVDVRAQHLLPDGTLDPAWPPTGLLVASACDDTLGPVVAGDGGSGVYVLYGCQGAPGMELRAAHVDIAGAIAWTVTVSSSPGNLAALRAVADGAGGVLAAWLTTGADADLRATRLQADGSPAPGWLPGGTLASTPAGARAAPTLAGDAAGGALLAWSERRAGAADADLYAQHLDAGGARAWGDAARALCVATGDQTAPSMAPDGAGGAYVAWIDGRAATAPDVYALRVLGDGATAAGWQADGTPLSTAPDAQVDVHVAANGLGEAFAVWNDARNRATTGTDIYAQRLRGDGPPPSQASGLTAFHSHGQTFLTWHCPPGTGWTYRVYRSNVAIATAGDLSHATLLAQVGDSTWYDRRLSLIRGQTCAYAVDSVAGPLAEDQGVVVITNPSSSQAWYAVTAQPATDLENTLVTPGDNALAQPLLEPLELPEPVFQRTLHVNGADVDVYTLWISSSGSPLFPPMSNRAGMAFDCGIERGTPGSALIVRPHARGSDFLSVVGGTSSPGEWVLALDDPLPNGQNTFWYGYHQAYDITGSNKWTPLSGTIVDYTWRRVIHTLGWARRRFPVDTTRVYAYGYSMGGIGSTMLAFNRPDWIAAVMSISGKFDFSFVDDPNPESAYNQGGVLRDVANWQWGPVTVDLMASDGLHVFERLNDDTLAALQEAGGVSPIIAFNGRYDTTTGWAEKIGFYRSMERHRHGGAYFWDTRTHVGGVAAWSPMENVAVLDRYRTNASYPAVTGCTADDDFGDGNPTAGDSVGTINGMVTWDAGLVDTPDRWSVTLRLQDLQTLAGTRPAPESVLVDVTPRRLQQFAAPSGQVCAWQATRLGAEGEQAGTVTVDSLGLITLRGIVVHKLGTVITLLPGVLAAPPASIPARLSLAPSRNPLRGAGALRVRWPRTGEARVTLLDVAGRVARVVWQGRAGAGAATLPLDTGALPSGLYFAEARQGDARAVTRLAIVR